MITLSLASAPRRALTLFVTTIFLSFTMFGPALANPVGGTVVGGSATISSKGSEVDINQSSNRAIIDWSSFNIGQGETTRFYQPNSGSLALNRVTNSAEASAINGNLIANGRVLVINPNGVIIGPHGNVDTAGFVASSADITNSNFMNGSQLNFNRAGN